MVKGRVAKSLGGNEPRVANGQMAIDRVATGLWWQNARWQLAGFQKPGGNGPAGNGPDGKRPGGKGPGW